ncbi:MAG: GrpB family protein [Pyramidobacter sp.]|jgi:GrpB-like predicted nucleotidyltransferase (UPF0157 family)
MIGLKKGIVKLVTHQDEWEKEAKRTIEELKHLLGNTAIDIQHIGSTAISSIHAKPIIDIVVGVYDLIDIMPSIDVLEENGIIFRGQDVPKQVLFVKGDFDRDFRTHYIHVVKWNDNEWNNYINFRDYLNAFPEKALAYDRFKQKLAIQFSEERKQYTEGKQQLINKLLEEARLWRAQR